MKNILIHIRTWIKLTSVAVLAGCLIIGIIAFVYKPTYGVYINGKFKVGYTKIKAICKRK